MVHFKFKSEFAVLDCVFHIQGVDLSRLHSRDCSGFCEGLAVFRKSAGECPRKLRLIKTFNDEIALASGLRRIVNQTVFLVKTYGKTVARRKILCNARIEGNL